jgi:hypothetical protein
MPAASVAGVEPAACDSVYVTVEAPSIASVPAAHSALDMLVTSTGGGAGGAEGGRESNGDGGRGGESDGDGGRGGESNTAGGGATAGKLDAPTTAQPAVEVLLHMPASCAPDSAVLYSCRSANADVARLSSPIEPSSTTFMLPANSVAA